MKWGKKRRAAAEEERKRQQMQAWLDHKVAMHAEEATNVRRNASWMVTLLFERPSKVNWAFNDAPAGIPGVEWDGRATRNDKPVPVGGNLGECFAALVPNMKPSSVFNTGFYAAILAFKEGAIDIMQFTHIEESNDQ